MIVFFETTIPDLAKSFISVLTVILGLYTQLALVFGSVFLILTRVTQLIIRFGWGSLLFHIRWRRKLKLPHLFDELKYESVTDAQKMVLSYPYLTTISGFISHSASSKCEMDMLDWHVSYMFCCDIGLVCPFIFCWLLWWLVKAFETSQNVFLNMTMSLLYSHGLCIEPIVIWWNGRFASLMHVQMHDAIMSIWAEI